MKGRVLVAGATGYLGKYVVRAFKRQDYWIRALVRNPQKLNQTGPFLEPAIKTYVDEMFCGDVTKPASLEGICKDIDIVFSSIGLTKLNSKYSFRDIDYQGNKHLLDQALKSGVKKFIFVSVFNAHKCEHLAGIRAKEDFVRELKNTGLNYVIIRPTGFFSDMTIFLQMARKGRVYLIGDGQNKINPIHGDDLAKVCVEAIKFNATEISVGGPEVYTYQEIAKMAFRVIKEKEKITYLPGWLVNFTVKIVRFFHAQLGDLMAFLSTALQNDAVAPKTGTYTLKDYYEEIEAIRYFLR